MAGDDASNGICCYSAIFIYRCVRTHSYMDYRIYMALVALIDSTVKLLYLYFQLSRFCHMLLLVLDALTSVPNGLGQPGFTCLRLAGGLRA